MSEGKNPEPYSFIQPPLWEEAIDDELAIILKLFPLIGVDHKTQLEEVGIIYSEQDYARDIHRYMDNHPSAKDNPHFLEAVMRGYCFAKNEYDNGDSGHYAVYSYAKVLAELNIENPKGFMAEIGIKVVDETIEWMSSVLDQAPIEYDDVRMKRLSPAYHIAKELFENGIDPEGKKLGQITELIFSVLPYCGPEWVYLSYRKEDIAQLFTIQRLFGNVVKDRYRSYYDEAFATGNFIRANNVLEVLVTLGHARIDEAKMLLQAMDDNKFWGTRSIALSWFKSYGLPIAKEIAERAKVEDYFKNYGSSTEEPF